MRDGLVTTIVPVFNRPKMLREAVASVLAQTYRPIEIIIVDDGSIDETAAVADELQVENPDIIRVLHIPNGGPGVAREAGRHLVRGEFLQHLDSDDLLLPRKFELQVAALRNAVECGVAYGWTRFRHANGNIEERPWKRSGERIATMFPAMLQLRWWDTNTPLYRAALLRDAGPWTDLRIEEDWEYDCRIATLGVRLAYCEDWVCEVRRHDEHASGHHDATTLRDRARAHLLILQHARTASIQNDAPEMLHYARELFLLARQCGAAGLDDESRNLVEASRTIAQPLDIRFYTRMAGLFGWRRVAALSALVDRIRS